MKSAVITIEQNDDGTKITDVTFDMEESQGLSASNILAMMIRESINDPACVEIMTTNLNQYLALCAVSNPDTDSIH